MSDELMESVLEASEDAVKNAVTAASIHTRLQLLEPSRMRLIMPPFAEGEDPDKEWKDWARRVERLLGRRIPGSWKTKRLAKKRRKWLLIHSRSAAFKHLMKQQ